MPNSSLEGSRAKISRAKYHLKQLHTTIESWALAEEEDHAPDLQYNPDRQSIDITLRKVRANDPDWALIIGDTVHNLRSALDHLVFQLALLNGRSVVECNKTAFPICIDQASFNKAKSRIEGFVSDRAFTMIKELQPYNAANPVGKDPRTSNLWIVSRLDIIDKHRMLVVSAKFFRTTHISYTFKGITKTVAVEGKWQPLENGAQLGSLDMTGVVPDLQDKMRVQAQAETQIFFNETGCGCDGLTVEDALRACIRYFSDIVELFASQFFNDSSQLLRR